VLLSEEANPIDHLLGSGTRGLETIGESGVLLLEKLDALGRDDTLHACYFQAFEPSFCLKSPASERSELVAEMLHQLLELRESGALR
jgi:hypothetical protein